MVSRALSPSGRVDEEKRRLVIETAKKYDFKPNRFASRLSGREIKIGILICYSFAPIYKKMIRGIEKAYAECKDYKISYTVSTVHSFEKHAWECEDELFSLKDCDGVIIAGFGSKKCTDMLSRFVEVNPNLVQMQSINEDADCLFVSRHDEKIASSLAADFLNSCLKGSEKNVLLFTGNKTSFLHRSAERAFAEACLARRPSTAVN